MPARSIRVLVVEDFEPFRRVVESILGEQPELQIVCEVSDGLEAVQKAKELQPDLILVDIGLPNLNGIEAARQICKVSPRSKILFLSENRSRDIAEEGLRVGAGGYVVKSDAARELLPAVEAVLKGKEFVSASLAGHYFTDPKDEHTTDHNRGGFVLPFPAQNVRIARRHEAGFYSDDRTFLDDLTQFIGAGLRAGNAAIVVSTESHRDSLLPRLQWAQGNAEAAIQVEKLGNQLVKTYDVDILCGYSLASVQGGMDSQIFQRICAEHSAVHSQ